MINNQLKRLILFIIILTFLSGCAKPDRSGIEKLDTTKEPEHSVNRIAHPCENIFYPLIHENQWVYQLDYEDQSLTDSPTELALTVSEVYQSSAVLAALDYDTGVVTQSTVDCNDGAIVNFPITELNMVLGDVSGALEFEYVSGTFMPSEKEFADSGWQMKWKTEYKATGEMNASYDGENLSIKLSSSPINMEWETVSTGGSLQVPAGNFDEVVQIKRRMKIDVDSLEAVIEGQQINLSTTLTLDTSHFYAPRTGLLKQEFESASIKIFGINTPTETWGKLELKSYQLNDY